MPTTAGRPGPASKVHLLREDPDLASKLPDAEREEAERSCVAELLTVPRGTWRMLDRGLKEGIGLLVLDGVLIRTVGIDSRYGSELLGQGDLLRPWQDDEESPTLPLTAAWRVLTPLRVANLDLEFARCAARWPEVGAQLVGRALQRSRHLAINMAIVQNPRIDARLHILLWHLAARWGRVGPQGVEVSIPLTHSVLAELIASRRPTVTTALGELARRGVVEPREKGWLLRGGPPRELFSESSLRSADALLSAPPDRPPR